MYGQWCKIDGNILLAEKNPLFLGYFIDFFKAIHEIRKFFKNPLLWEVLALGWQLIKKWSKYLQASTLVPFFFKMQFHQEEGEFHLPKMEKRFLIKHTEEELQM